ncbi:aromatase/cyclase [Actinokineospora enzanensis]|uniref:aromatase/cyclase n=1 Tax=Actinokineospora enzanensis TaxID=155975 RepID=UPI00036DBA7A|nr:aromatase/cyclase [Actinokineospora enzanensis]
MTTTRLATHHVRHTVVADAPAEVLHRVVAEVERWPMVLGPTVHVERIDGDGRTELLRLWATANGEVRTWTSRRDLAPTPGRIAFRQQQPSPPVAAMGGAWAFESLGDGGTRVVLDHDFAAEADDPDAVTWIRRAVDRNSEAELAAIADHARSEDRLRALELDFTDTVEITGPVDGVYDFLRDAAHWPERIPHVDRLELIEDTPGLQLMIMDTRTADGSVHTTRSARVCLPDHRIVYKQLEPPALLDAHTGEWTLTAAGNHVRASSRHTIRIRPDAVERVLGAGATVDDAKEFVRTALGTNSTATLHRAAEHVRG